MPAPTPSRVQSLEDDVAVGDPDHEQMPHVLVPIGAHGKFDPGSVGQGVEVALGCRAALGVPLGQAEQLGPQNHGRVSRREFQPMISCT